MDFESTGAMQPSPGRRATVSLRGDVAIVTGAGGPNMGRAAARLFAACGVSVCVADVDREQGEETVRSIAAEGGDAFFVPTDLLDEDSVRAMVERTLARFGHLDYMCNFAAQIEPRVGVLKATTADFDRIVGVTLRGAWLVTKYAMGAMVANDAPALHDSRGAIVLIASTVAHRGGGNYVAYTAAKSGMLGLLRSAAIDGGPHKIRVNCVSPGATRTPATPIATPKEERKIAALGVLPYVGESEDMAQAALWLCSDEARFITGATLPIDGGWTAKL